MTNTVGYELQSSNDLLIFTGCDGDNSPRNINKYHKLFEIYDSKNVEIYYWYVSADDYNLYYSNYIHQDQKNMDKLKI